MVSRCSNSIIIIILIMKRLVILFDHIFSENNEDTLQSLPLNMHDQTLIHV